MTESFLNKFLLAFAWCSAIAGKVLLALPPFWVSFLQFAPWVTSFLFYLANFDKVNTGAKKIIKAVFKKKK